MGQDVDKTEFTREDRQKEDLDDRTLHVRGGEGLEGRDHGHRPASPPSAPTIVRVLASIELR